MKLDCLVLAAGNASRFGACKLLADWNGQPLVAASMQAASMLELNEIKIVTGAYHQQLIQTQALLKSINSRIEFVEFQDWQLGLGHSLAFGVEQFAEANALLILLGDQPLVNKDELVALYSAWCEYPEKIACASFADTLGVPAIFPSHIKNELRACNGDRGAKSVLSKHSQSLVAVAMPHAEFDVDTPEDLNKLLLKYVV